jgi:sigma-E factor negative regulatory protein RseB
MMRQQCYSVAAAWIALGSLCAAAPVVAADAIGPHEWLDRMAIAVQTTNYQGTVIRLQNGRVEALSVVRKVIDGVIHERVVVQEGNGLEIVRHGNEVHCILPDRKSVLVEEWNDQGTLFSTLPSSDIRFGSEYDVLIVRKDRVAARKAVMLAIRPHDNFRYGHRIWLDIETGFPLQTQLIGDDGNPLEQVKFVAIDLDSEIPASALASSYNTENFRWYTQPSRKSNIAVETDWSAEDLPSGFRVVSTRQEQVAGAEKPVLHILYGDGLANVSVFIATNKDKNIEQRSRVGASNAYSVASGNYRVTAVGEVPAVTVQHIAESVHPGD